ILLLSLFFLFRNWREWKWFGIPLIAMDLLYLVVIGKFRDFHGGVCPGPRYFLSLVPLNLAPLFFGMADIRNRNLPIAAVICFLIVVGIFINGYSATVDYTTAPSAWDYWSGFFR
ncbi:MAG: hypothetical protein KC978_25385, partial [Candidatus Omnitrophica bacterium]|nr:hypothetical protein [Candidatus Omnitrophota bacterium]